MKRSLFCLLVVFVAIVSCEKDENADMGRKSGFIGYDILLSDDFKQGKTKSGGTVGEDRKVTIGKFEGELGGESLYLHTIEQEWRPDAQATKGTIISSLANKGMGISAWVYKTDAYAAGQSYFSNDEHSVGSGAVTTGRYWPQKKDGWNMRFYAYAPLDAQNGEASTEGSVSYVTLPDVAAWTGGIPSFSYTVPSDVTRQTDLLVASSDVQNDSETYGTAAVPMDFGHALTAVQFMVDGLSELKIKQIKISGVKNSGTYTYAYNVNGDGQSTTATHDAGVWSAQSGVGEYVLDFTSGALDTADGNQTPDGAFVCSGQEKFILNKDESDYVLFMMPQVLGESAIIEVEGESNGNEISLSASLQGKEWTKGQRVIYKISISEIDVHYVFEVEDVTTDIGFKAPAEEVVETKIESADIVPFYGQLGREYKVTSYKEITRLGQNTPERVNLEWKIDREATNDWIDWISEPVFTNEYNGELTGTYNVVAGVPNGTSHYNLSGNPKGTADSPHDLSEGTETANCYIVDAPGYYKLPLIYGNARGANGLRNQNSYSTEVLQGGPKSASTTSGVQVSVVVNVLSWFMNYNGDAISDHYILKDVANSGGNVEEADVIWQDEPCLVTELEIKDDFLHFRVREDCICEGNAVIAIKEKDTYVTGDNGEPVLKKGTVFWSWHIWVTDIFKTEQQQEVDVFNRRVIKKNPETDEESKDGFAVFVSNKFKMMPSYIGFCDGELKEYKERGGEIVFVQYDDGVPYGDPIKLQIRQEGKSISTPDNTLYYQYGRKDPRPSAYAYANDSGEYNITNDKDYYLSNRRQYHNGYDGLGCVGFYERSEKEEFFSIYDGIKTPGIQMPNFNNDDNDDKDWDYDIRIKEELGDWSIIRAGFWYNYDKYNRPLTLFNLWNTNSNVLPMFTMQAASTNGYMTTAEMYSNLDDLINLGVTKTIYDPCPRGYEMPRVDVFMGFTYDGLNTEAGDVNYSPNIIFGNPGFDAIGGYRFGNTPMDGPKIVDSGAKPILIRALGYRNNKTGSIEGYRSYGSALTSAPICVELGENNYFSLQVAKLYFKYDSKSPLVYPMSSSDFSLAFPVIPVKTGANPEPGSERYYDSDNIPETYNKVL